VSANLPTEPAVEPTPPFEESFAAKVAAAQASAFVRCETWDADGGALCDREKDHPGSHMTGKGKARTAW
jgi:hypothetical protein